MTIQTLPITIPIFTREVLEKLKIVALRTICKKYNISLGRKKASYVDNILKKSQTMHKDRSEVDKVFKSITSRYLEDPAPMHGFYKEQFNLADLANSKWYKVDDKHGHNS